jgi:hypothetical protein
MNTKRFFAGLTAMALSIGVVLAGCEGPAGADGAPGSGGGGGGGSGPIEGTVITKDDMAAFDASIDADAVRLPPGTYALINGGAVAEINGASDIAVYKGYTLNLYGDWKLASGYDVYVGGTLNIMNRASLDVDAETQSLYIGMATGATTGAGTVNVKAGGTLKVEAPETYLSFLTGVAGGVETYDEPPVDELAEAIIDGDPLAGIPGVALTFAGGSSFDSPLDTGDAPTARALAAFTRFHLPNLETTTADTADGALTVAAGNKLTVTTATYEGITALNIYGELDGSSDDPTFAAVTAFTLGPKAVIDVGTGATFAALTTLTIGADAELDFTGATVDLVDLTSLTVNGTLVLTDDADLTTLLTGTSISGTGTLDASAVSAGYTAVNLAKLLGIANVKADLAGDELDADLTVPTGSTLELSNGSAVEIADGVTLTVNGELILPSGTDLTLTGVGDASYSATLAGSGTITINSGAIKVVGAIGTNGETDGDATLTIGGTLKVDVLTANAITVTGGAGETVSGTTAGVGGAGAILIIGNTATVYIPLSSGQYIKAIGGAGGGAGTSGGKAGGGGGGGAVIVGNGRIRTTGTASVRTDYTLTAATVSSATTTGGTGGSIVLGNGGANDGVTPGGQGMGVGDASSSTDGDGGVGAASSATVPGAGGTGGPNSGSTNSKGGVGGADATYGGGGGGGGGTAGANGGGGGGGGAAINNAA